MNNRPVLEAKDLKVAYGGNLALDLPHLAVRERELVGVVGANGAGKSTLVNGLVGWSRGTPKISGKVLLDGRDISGLPTHERVRSGLLLIPEGKLVFTQMTVEENLSSTSDETDLGQGRRRYSTDEVYGLFPRLHERRHHLGSQLSGGERQMLGIARALRLGPRALLLDEPSIGLAPRLVSTVLDTVRSLVDSGLTVLLVEQNVRAAIEVVDRLVLLERGRIIAEGPAADMRDDPRIAEAYLGAHVA
ncbi:ABC transporter ATP-binding protein [Microvirga lenta]|uniref:ABC transporter ATP-binding protein n=1 Tax=Microvirga lenta TaxID=2881337 RepID=UPI001CFC4A8C|nr:ABC transporter ATP-binding protein [Microvirga lenta]MCB5174623.1 ABC transporter ATP-binding protein [Microvirga lenta]